MTFLSHPTPPTQCYFHGRLQKMTTVASPPDARHLKHVLNPQTTNQCHLFPSLQPSDPTAVDGNGGSQLEDWEMSNPPGFCWISSDVSGGRNRDGGGNRRVFVGNLAYSNGLSMSQSSESAGWMSFLFFFTSALAWKLRCSFSGPREAQPSEKYHGLPPSIARCDMARTERSHAPCWGCSAGYLAYCRDSVCMRNDGLYLFGYWFGVSCVLIL